MENPLSHLWEREGPAKGAGGPPPPPPRDRPAYSLMICCLASTITSSMRWRRRCSL
jgi:hypothetical protein